MEMSKITCGICNQEFQPDDKPVRYGSIEVCPSCRRLLFDLIEEEADITQHCEQVVRDLSEADARINQTR